MQRPTTTSRDSGSRPVSVTAMTAQSASQGRPASQNSPLLDLPRELRDYIWESATTFVDAPIAIDNPSFGAEKGLLGSCRQTREEASPYFYGFNTFTCSLALDGKPATTFLDRISREMAGRITALELDVGNSFEMQNEIRWHEIRRHEIGRRNDISVRPGPEAGKKKRQRSNLEKLLSRQVKGLLKAGVRHASLGVFDYTLSTKQSAFDFEWRRMLGYRLAFKEDLEEDRDLIGK